jgi:hypothetical protein
MKIQKYKPGKQIFSSNNKNKYNQFYDWNGKLSYKGYYKNGKRIGYQEVYRELMNKGIKYKI